MLEPHRAHWQSYSRPSRGGLPPNNALDRAGAEPAAGAQPDGAVAVWSFIVFYFAQALAATQRESVYTPAARSYFATQSTRGSEVLRYANEMGFTASTQFDPLHLWCGGQLRPIVGFGHRIWGFVRFHFVHLIHPSQTHISTMSSHCIQAMSVNRIVVVSARSSNSPVFHGQHRSLSLTTPIIVSDPTALSQLTCLKCFHVSTLPTSPKLTTQFASGKVPVLASGNLPTRKRCHEPASLPGCRRRPVCSAHATHDRLHLIRRRRFVDLREVNV